MSKFIKNKNTGKVVEYPPYKCKLCGLGDISHNFEICEFCGWEDDNLQFDNKDFVGGANKMSYNQYLKFWTDNKKILSSKPEPLLAINLSEKYYNTHFKKIDDEIIKRELNGEVIQKLK